MDSAEAMAEWANDLKAEINAEVCALRMGIAVLFGGIQRLSPDTAAELMIDLRKCSAYPIPPDAALRVELMAQQWAAMARDMDRPAWPT